MQVQFLKHRHSIKKYKAFNLCFIITGASNILFVLNDYMYYIKDSNNSKRFIIDVKIKSGKKCTLVHLHKNYIYV